MFKYICLFASIALVCAQTTQTTVKPSDATKELSAINGTSTHLTTIDTNSTTTQKSTNSTTTLTTTTEKSTTKVTTTPKPTPKPTPPPVPTPTKFTGNVTENNKTCIKFEFGVKITLKYNTSNELVSTGFIFPANSTVELKSSNCNSTDETEIVTITFNEVETTASLTLRFNRSESEVYVNDIELSFKATDVFMPGFNSSVIATIIATKSNLNLFKVATKHSYLCSAVQSADLISQNEYISDVHIEFTDSQIEAYLESDSGKFDSAIDCKSADISDVVPIAVGAALAGLVIIVLIAYFIGRRRSRRLAYQSV